jgi:hypothetical protein
MAEGCVAVKVYTDHKSAEDVLNSRSFKTTSSVRQNLRLIRASQFISLFQNLKVIYRPGKDNVNADALSCLITLRNSQMAKPPENDDDKGIYSFMVMTVALSTQTLAKIENGYKSDPHLCLVYHNVKEKMERQQQYVDHQLETVTANDVTRHIDRNVSDDLKYAGFEGRMLDGHLLLYIKSARDTNPRLCIPSSCYPDFLKAAHDDANHAGFDKAYDRLSKNYYLRRLSTLLRNYIRSCPSCQINKPVHH